MIDLQKLAELADVRNNAAYIASLDPQTVQALLEAVEMLRLVLPMAKGYAREHPVGSNQDYVNAAVEALSAFQEPTP